jgi:maltoporin
MRSTSAQLIGLLVVSLAGTATAQPAEDTTTPPVPVGEVDAPPPEQEPEAEPTANDGTFGFGSYGRVGVGTDLHGSTPEQTNVVAHGSRIAEPSYLELDFYYGMKTANDVELRTVTTLAFADTLFHYTGEFDAQPALRNVYAEATIRDELGLWIGSRMYRGDDIFLFDYWPLDDLNTIGGGASFRRDRLAVEAHVGANRLLDPYQFQQRDVTDPDFGAQTITQLDRQRMLASAKWSYRFLGIPGEGLNMKAKLYGEVHVLPDGTRLRGDDTQENLPSDFGWSVGGQLGAWGFAEGRSHANLFARYSRGLAAFDELAPPMGFDDTRKVSSASEVLLALSGNYELPFVSVLAGAYARRFVDADGNAADRDDGWEYIVDIRPMASVMEDVQVGVDLSYQVRFPRGLSPTAGIAYDPAVFAIAPMALYSPFGSGSYDRPQLRLIYRAAKLNEGALDLYALDDPRRNRSWVHFLGLQAEWWFNSTYR